jgi:hypothetical protein
MLNVIQNIYKDIKSNIIFNNSKSDYFPCDNGIRQGGNLSLSYLQYFWMIWKIFWKTTMLQAFSQFHKILKILWMYIYEHIFIALCRWHRPNGRNPWRPSKTIKGILSTNCVIFSYPKLLSISILTFIKWRLTPSYAAKDMIFWQKKTNYRYQNYCLDDNI